MKLLINIVLALFLFSSGTTLTAQSNMWKTLSKITYKKEYDELMGFKVDAGVCGDGAGCGLPGILLLHPARPQYFTRIHTQHGIHTFSQAANFLFAFLVAKSDGQMIDDPLPGVPRKRIANTPEKSAQT